MLSGADLQYDRPFVVYLTSSAEADATAQEVVDMTTLRDERVAIASKFFSMVKVDGAEIGKDHPYAKWIGGKDLPRFVVFSAAGDRVGKVEGRVSPSKLYGMMKGAVAKDYVTNVDKVVKDYQKILTALDRLNVLKTTLDQKEARSDTKRDEREVAREREQLAKEEEELRLEEEKLLDFKRRNAA